MLGLDIRAPKGGEIILKKKFNTNLNAVFLIHCLRHNGSYI